MHEFLFIQLQRKRGGSRVEGSHENQNIVKREFWVDLCFKKKYGLSKLRNNFYKTGANGRLGR